MACPHSNAPGSSIAGCSLCQGVKPRIVSVREKVVMIDGSPIGYLDQINRMRFEQETQSSLPDSKKRCSRCQVIGHNVRTCSVNNEATRAHDVQTN